MALEVPGSNPGRALTGTLAQLGEHQDVSPPVVAAGGVRKSPGQVWSFARSPDPTRAHSPVTVFGVLPAPPSPGPTSIAWTMASHRRPRSSSPANRISIMPLTG